MIAKRRVGFWRGFTAPLSAARGLLQQPRCWPYVLLPALVFLLIEAAFIAVAWRFLAPWVETELPVRGPLQRGLIQLLSVVTMAFGGWLVAIVLAPAISAPALERIVYITEEDLGAPARAQLGFVTELLCGIRSMLWSTAVTLPILVVLSLLELSFPPLSLFVTPIKLLLGALGLAWGLFDYPLTLRGLAARQRLAFMRRHLPAVIGFGTCFSVLFWVPCFGILMLPIGVAGATRLYWTLERQ